MTNKIIYIETTRYSAFFKEVFRRLEGDIIIKIDGEKFTNEDIPFLLDDWCTNRQILATQTFGLIRNGKAVIGFFDSPDNLWVDIELELMVIQLREAKIIRFTMSEQREGVITKIRRKMRGA
ncbi:MAG: hypothetical protein ACFFCW_42195 [Candidatus Hodarchaeota archaeon]